MIVGGGGNKRKPPPRRDNNEPSLFEKVDKVGKQYYERPKYFLGAHRGNHNVPDFLASLLGGKETCNRLGTLTGAPFPLH
jgi:hypothetical protein